MLLAGRRVAGAAIAALYALSLVIAANPAVSQPITSRVETPQRVGLPNGDAWLRHFRDDLLPFWNMPDAWGEPRGNFPTFRCDDGSIYIAEKPCAELAAAPAWIQENLGREFVRMKSRQTYFYAVAYHLTGEPRMLELARAGVDFIRAHALDRDSGSAITYWQAGEPAPPVLQRTSQDLAYAQLGMAMYYYVTRDEGVLRDVLRLKDHIFGNYWNRRWDMLMWLAEDDGHGGSTRQELVAQLDQINAYMLLLAPLLPEPQRAQWRNDLRRLAGVMIAKYYSPRHRLFWGTVHDPRQRVLGSRHTDFGHSAKALWMIERIGMLYGDRALKQFAAKEGRALLKTAYLSDSGSWGSRLRSDGSRDTDKEWWIYAELDQLAATLALAHRGPTRYLARTYEYWMERFVDARQHEVWGRLRGSDNQRAPGPKIHHWKNGYHSAEHALVGYITAQALAGRPVTLYFAFDRPRIDVRPYFFSGHVTDMRFEPLPGFPGLQKMRLVFDAIR